MQKSQLSKASILFTAVLTLGLPIAASAASQSFVLQCASRCDAVAAAIRQIPGARVDQVYQNVNGLAVTLPASAIAAVQARADVTGMAKDLAVSLPPAGAAQALPTPDSTQVLTTAQLPGFIGARPNDYSFNNDLIGATAIQNQGYLGTGVVVAVIDSGIANNPTVVPSIAGNVIGGESMRRR